MYLNRYLAFHCVHKLLMFDSCNMQVHMQVHMQAQRGAGVSGSSRRRARRYA